MAGPYRARIPFESLDPLTIGASDDESKVYREELELEFPAGNLLAAIYPEEPEPVASATEAAREALTSPTSGPSFAELLDGAVVLDDEILRFKVGNRVSGVVLGHNIDRDQAGCLRETRETGRARSG